MSSVDSGMVGPTTGIPVHNAAAVPVPGTANASANATAVSSAGQRVFGEMEGEFKSSARPMPSAAAAAAAAPAASAASPVNPFEGLSRDALRETILDYARPESYTNLSLLDRDLDRMTTNFRSGRGPGDERLTAEFARTIPDYSTSLARRMEHRINGFVSRVQDNLYVHFGIGHWGAPRYSKQTLMDLRQYPEKIAKKEKATALLRKYPEMHSTHGSYLEARPLMIESIIEESLDQYPLLDATDDPSYPLPETDAPIYRLRTDSTINLVVQGFGVDGEADRPYAISFPISTRRDRGITHNHAYVFPTRVYHTKNKTSAHFAVHGPAASCFNSNFIRGLSQEIGYRREAAINASKEAMKNINTAAEIPDVFLAQFLGSDLPAAKRISLERCKEGEKNSCGEKGWCFKLPPQA